MAFARNDNVLSPYRKFLVELSSYLSGNDLETLKFAVLDLIPRVKTEDVSSGLKLFDILEQDSRITPGNLSLLDELFETIGRMDLAWKVQCFTKSSVGDYTNGKLNFDEMDAVWFTNIENIPISCLYRKLRLMSRGSIHSVYIFERGFRRAYKRRVLSARGACNRNRKSASKTSCSSAQHVLHLLVSN